jgi:hypothetical protein
MLHTTGNVYKGQTYKKPQTNSYISRYFQYSYIHFIHSVVCLEVHSLFQRELYTTGKFKRTMLLLQQKPLHSTEQVHFCNCHETPVEQAARVSHVTATVTVASYRCVLYSQWGKEERKKERKKEKINQSKKSRLKSRKPLS